MSNLPTFFAAVIFFILGNITCHLYKQQIINNLNSKCLRAHIGDMDNIESETAEYLGYTKNKLDAQWSAQIKEIKDTFGI